MKRLSKRASTISTVAIIIAGTAIYFAFFNHGKPIVNIKSTPEKVNPQPLFIEPAQVFVMSYGLEPKTVTIKQGQAVVWINKDAKLHQIASDPYPSEDGLAGFASQGASLRTEVFLFTFFTKGTYTYHDHLNPSTYKGTVIVQ